MRKNYFIIVFIITISLFCGNGINVRAESYIARSAPESLKTNVSAYYAGSDGMAGVYAGKTNTSGRDAVLYNESFAATNVGDNLSGYRFFRRYGYIFDAHIGLSYNLDTNEVTRGAKLFVTDSMNYTVCGIEHNSSYQYNKVSSPVDYGIVYIIANAKSFLDKNGINTNTGTNGDLELAWFTQVAIWKYQNLNNFANISMTSNNIDKHIPPLGETNYEEKQVESTRVSTRAISLWNLASKLVIEARAAKDVTVTFNYDGNFSILEESQKVKTSLASIPNHTSFSSYSLDISRAPSGTKVYNESNAEITNLTNIPSNTKFSLEIPVENIENFTYDFSVIAEVNRGNYKGYKYISTSPTATNSLVLVTNEPTQLQTSIKFNATHVEDSASSVSKIVYIGGLVILLCGFGIVYYNLKPRKQEI